MMPVNVLDGTPANAVTWENNVIYGGSQKGVSLDTVSKAPEYEDRSAEISAIRENAGVQW